MQHGIGTIHTLSNRKGSWASGIRTRLSRSLGARGRASDAGNSPLPHWFQIGVSYSLGFRFFEMTSLGMLTMLIQRYKVQPHPKFAGESFEQLKERYSQARVMLTLT